MRPTLRRFAEQDYPALVRVLNGVFPEYPSTEEEVRFEDEHRDLKTLFERWVIETAQGVVAFGEYSQHAAMYHPRRFRIEVAVLPAHQGQGHGARLYEQVMAALAPREPLSVRANARADWARSARFLQERGFAEDMRSWESRLDLKAFDPSPWIGVEGPLRAAGIQIRALAELAPGPDRDRQLYALEQDLEADVPHPEPRTPISFERFLAVRLADPRLLPEGWFLSLAPDGELVGMSNLWASPEDDHLYVGLTGVRRAWRRKGIALALKLRAIQYARERGRALLKTWNESNNRPMLAINEQLGFVKQAIWINFVKRVGEGEPTRP